MRTRPLRVALIASARFPIREPYAGGLEAQTAVLAAGLRRRGHDVTLFAAPGSDPALGARLLDVAPLRISAAAESDVSMPSRTWLSEHHAYLSLMLDLIHDRDRPYDVVHNNSLHYLPLAMARALPISLLTTLHTPPTPWIESAIAAGPCPVCFVAVSRATQTAWQHAVPCARVVPNGIDLDMWPAGPGGPAAVWFGRIVPEKGTDVAIRVARRAGVPLRIVGPIADERYFAQCVQPLLGDDARYLGHCTHDELARIVGRSRFSLVTARWDEPYGLVAAESLACGTPVVGFARGGLAEVVDPTCAVLVAPDDEDALVSATARAAALPRTAARRRAEQRCSAEQMIDAYEMIYHELRERTAA
jgi:glycosyltransferase involved in cell wall biosynthesis